MSTTVKWGLITGMVYVFFSLISNMLGLQQGGGGTSNMGLGMLMNVLLFAGTFYTLYLGVKECREQDMDGYMTLGQGFKAGMKIAVIAATISGIFTFIYMKFIDPDMVDRIMEASEAQFDEMNVPEEQREMSRSIAGWFLNPVLMAPFMFIWVSFWGLIKSLIAGSMLKREAPPTLHEEPPTVPTV